MSRVCTHVVMAGVLLMAWSGHKEGMFVDGGNVTCVSADAPIVSQIFGISVYEDIRHPVIPIQRKAMCISDIPHVDIRIGEHSFNPLNATVSVAACRHMYQQLICADLKPNIDNECQYANLIIFAATESMAECNSNTDCIGIGNRYDLPALWCDWTLEMSKHVCKAPFSERLLNTCEVDVSRATRIRTACVFTDTFCAYVVNNMYYLAPLSGVTMFLTSFCVIYFTNHSSKGR